MFHLPHTSFGFLLTQHVGRIAGLPCLWMSKVEGLVVAEDLWGGLVGWRAGGLVGCSSSLGLGAGQGWAKVRLGQDPVFGAVLSPPNIPTFTAAYP